MAVGFLHAVVAAFPYRLHTVLTDNGIQFADWAQDRWNGRHFFGRVCDRHGIEHRLTKPAHPWANGQVEPLDHERMNRTIKEATVKRVPLREPCRAARALVELPAGVQPREAVGDAPGADAVRVRVRRVGEVARALRPRSYP